MAAARVMNRIVAVVDNDTAGRVAADQLADLAFPARIAATNLPEVTYATQYPTLGPEGSSTANVNGRATSIEFMFGEDILRDTDGALFPERWQSYIETACDYQGRLDGNHKTTVGRRIDKDSRKPTTARCRSRCLMDAVVWPLCCSRLPIHLRTSRH